MTMQLEDALYGMPSFGSAQSYLTSLGEKSGMLDTYGWTKGFQEAFTVHISELLASGLLKAEKDPKVKCVFTNTATRLTSNFRVCTTPHLLRHGARGRTAGLASGIIEDLRILNETRWVIHPACFDMLDQIGDDSDLSELVMDQAPTFPDACVVSREFPFFHIPNFRDKVGRTYGEGALSYTGSKLVRASLSLYDELPYTVDDVIQVCDLWDFPLWDVQEILDTWQIRIKANPVKGWELMQKAIWIQDVLTKGRSGVAIGCDIVGSGPGLAALVSACRSLLRDSNLLGPDDRDYRKIIGNRIHVPPVLLPWADLCRGKGIAKDLLTAAVYGEAAAGGAEGLLWENQDRAPVGWKNSLGMINPLICAENPEKYNTSMLHVIEELGVAKYFGAAKALSASYNSTFWASYPEVLVLRQRLEGAYNTFKAKQHGPAKSFVSIIGPDGSVYTHTKWAVTDKADTSWRLRYKGVGAEEWPNGLDLTFAGMEDVASGFTLFVRWIHWMDAWFKRGVNKLAAKKQRKLFGRVVGMGSVHDCFIQPVAMLPYMHDIVRTMLHLAMKVWPPIINKFLTDNGQEPMPLLSDAELARFHKTVNTNRGFLSMK